MQAFLEFSPHYVMFSGWVGDQVREWDEASHVCELGW